MTESQIAMHFLNESLPQKWIDTAKARAALAGSELRVTPVGYQIVARSKTAVLQTWRHVEALIEFLEDNA
ncbi:MAG: hypothetical protein Q8K24_09435 [Hydrogenophaga sp.]|nr:hypothetical protein [Hydrogenophaga sp.]